MGIVCQSVDERACVCDCVFMCVRGVGIILEHCHDFNFCVLVSSFPA